MLILPPMHPVHVTQKLRAGCLSLHQNLAFWARKLFKVLVCYMDVVLILTLDIRSHSFASNFFEIHAAVLGSARPVLAKAPMFEELYFQILGSFRVAPGESLLGTGPTGIQFTFLFVFSLLVKDFYVFAVVDNL